MDGHCPDFAIYARIIENMIGSELALK